MVEWSDIEAKRGIAEQRGQQAVEFSAKGNTLADELRKAIGERFAESSIAKTGAEARTGFLAAAPQARSDVAGLIQGGAILSPTQQQAIIAAKRGAALAPVMGANVMQEAAFGTLEDLLNAGVNAYNAQAQKLQGLAGLAQTSYSNLLNELVQKAQMEYQQQQLQLSREAAAKPSTTTWEDASGNTWIVNSLTGEKIMNLGRTYHAPTGGAGDTEYNRGSEAYKQMALDANSMSKQAFVKAWVAKPPLTLDEASLQSYWDTQHPKQGWSFSNLLGGNSGNQSLLTPEESARMAQQNQQISSNMGNLWSGISSWAAPKVKSFINWLDESP